MHVLGAGHERKGHQAVLGYARQCFHARLHCIAVAKATAIIRIVGRDQRSPLVGCSSQNRLASRAFADPAAPARTASAIRADRMVFMVAPPLWREADDTRRRSSGCQEDASGGVISA